MVIFIFWNFHIMYFIIFFLFTQFLQTFSLLSLSLKKRKTKDKIEVYLFNKLLVSTIWWTRFENQSRAWHFHLKSNIRIFCWGSKIPESACFSNLINVYLVIIMQYQGYDTGFDLAQLSAHDMCHHGARGMCNIWRTKDKSRSQRMIQGSKCYNIPSLWEMCLEQFCYKFHLLMILLLL